MLSKERVLPVLLVIAVPLTSAQVNTKDVTYCCCRNFNMFSSIWLTEVFLSPSPATVAGTSRARESHGLVPLHYHHHHHHHHHGPVPLLYRHPPRASQVFRVVVLVDFRPQRPEASSSRGRPQNTNPSAPKSSFGWNPQAARGRRQLRMLESSSALPQLRSQPQVARGGRSLLSFPMIGREQVSPTLSLRPLWNILECQILGKFLNSQNIFRNVLLKK